MFSVWSCAVMCQHSSSLNPQKLCTCWHLSISTLVRVLIFSYSVLVFFLAQIFASNWQNNKQNKQTTPQQTNKQTGMGKRSTFRGNPREATLLDYDLCHSLLLLPTDTYMGNLFLLFVAAIYFRVLFTL